LVQEAAAASCTKPANAREVLEMDLSPAYVLLSTAYAFIFLPPRGPHLN
jgi:hypothetical protein